MGEQGIFKNIPNVILQIPRSIAVNNGTPKDQRLRRLIKSIGLLAKEMLVCIPAESCNWLEEDFFDNISGKKIKFLESVMFGF